MVFVGDLFDMLHWHISILSFEQANCLLKWTFSKFMHRSFTNWPKSATATIGFPGEQPPHWQHFYVSRPVTGCGSEWAPSSVDWDLEPLQLLAPKCTPQPHWCNNPCCKAAVCAQQRHSVWLAALLKYLWAEADCLDYSRVKTTGLGARIITAQSGRLEPQRSLADGTEARRQRPMMGLSLTAPVFPPPPLTPLHLYLESQVLTLCECRSLSLDVVPAASVNFGKHIFNLKLLCSLWSSWNKISPSLLWNLTARIYFLFFFVFFFSCVVVVWTGKEWFFFCRCIFKCKSWDVYSVNNTCQFLERRSNVMR